MFKKLLITTQLLFCIAVIGQTKNIYFQGDVIQMPNNIDTFTKSKIPANASFKNGFYSWVQFKETPTQEIQNQFTKGDYKLYNFIANNTYLAYFSKNFDGKFLKNSGIISILPVQNSVKISERIKHDDIADWAINGENILLNVEYFKNVSVDEAVAEINKIGDVEILKLYKTGTILPISIAKSKIQKLAESPVVKWIELIQAPSVKEDTRGRSIHRSSNLDTQTSAGRNYTGEGVGVMVRDDGEVGPHIDFQGRIDNSRISGTRQGTHGDGVAGIMTGAGNLDPTKRGMAANSAVYIVDYESSFLDNATTSLINSDAVQITNSSYGDGCNDGYTTTTNTVDTQANDNLDLLHVFSAGNSGSSICGYVAGANWGNITGGHKQGKNVIATANVFFDGGHVTSSSHGPAYDGRIKPDITAHGQGQLSTDEDNAYLSFGGTSGAAPGIAGVSAQLYQLYKDKNGGQFPEAALIKATLLNTAQDYGNVGPDFEYGWGLVNGLRAAMLLEDERHLSDNIAQAGTNTHTINVPAGTTQVRFMVYWNDPAATAGAATSLVNDLDLKVTNPSNTQFLPWVLNHAPNALTLDDPATTGEDHLNNMEQVLINTPEAGDYTLEIKGFNVPQGPQKYFVVYEIISDELVLTYPQGGEKMISGESETIHWDATNVTGDITIEYSENNGGAWNTITTVPASDKNFTWTVPSTTASDYLVRVTSGSYQSTSEKFTVSSLPQNLEVIQVCPENINMKWDAVTDATEYDIYLLGEKFMEKVGTSATNSFKVPITDTNQVYWVAVAAKGTNWEGRRSNAISTPLGLFNCDFNSDLELTSIVDNVSEVICQSSTSVNIMVNLKNNGVIDQGNFKLSYQLNNGTVVEETYTSSISGGLQGTYTFSTPLQLLTNGASNLKVWATVSGDENATNNEKTLDFYSQAISADFNEKQTFDVFPPEGWTTASPNDVITWEQQTAVGPDGQNTNTVYMNHSFYNTIGREDSFTTNIFDLTQLSSSPTLTFDLAKAQWFSRNDGLRVEVSTSCENNFTTVYEKDGMNLSTVPDFVVTKWTPASADDWRKETIDLTAYANQKIKLRFVAVNGFSNSTFIDNIEIQGTLSTKQNVLQDKLVVYPNPVDDILKIQLSNATISTVEVFDVFGKTIKSIKVNDSSFNLKTDEFSTGMYLIKIRSGEHTVFKKIIKK